jgi:N-methylhydantoinase A
VSAAGRALVGVDVGGTFTDVVRVLDGVVTVTKVPSEPVDTHRSVLAGAERLGVTDVAQFHHAGTHGLNAILTRDLPVVGLLTTRGHRDVLDQGRLWRPAESVTDPAWRRGFSDVARPLIPRYLRRGVTERITGTGAVLVPLDERQAIEQIEVLGRSGVAGVAICLLHSYRAPEHELRLRELVREHLGDVAVSVSHEVSPLLKEYERSSTTVVDAMMKIIYGRYDVDLRAGLAELGFPGRLHYADSAADLVPAEAAMQVPSRVVFSGPAAGTVAGAHLGRAIDDGDLLCVDVGGTSCDISLITAGEPRRDTTFEFEHDLVVNSPATDIATLGAGGGSVVWVDDLGQLRVGPQSAGARPGPACYGRGGTRPTVTDAALLLGLLDPEAFLGGAARLDPAAARAAFTALEVEEGLDERVHQAWQIALATIAEGVVDNTLDHGVDVRDLSLVAYGSAGPMLLPSVLDLVPARRVVVPPHPGLFSALGLLCGDLVHSDSVSDYVVLGPDSADRVATIFRNLEARLLKEVPPEIAGRARVTRSFDGRLLGQSWDTPFVEVPAGAIDAAAVAAMVEEFHAAYEARNRRRFAAYPVQAVTFRVRLVAESPKIAFTPLGTRTGGAPTPTGRAVSTGPDGPVEFAVHRREDLLAGDELAGPVIVREDLSTTVVPAGRHLRVGAVGELVIT